MNHAIRFVLLLQLLFTMSPCGAKSPQWPDLGPNVLIFDAHMPAADIQQQVDSIYAEQMANQFGESRYALLFKPGRYQTLVKTGFYTQVLGLGRTPAAVTLEGGLYVDAVWHDGDATQNFWRGAENLSIIPTGGTMQWAVSQASPLRRMHIQGHLILDDHSGWSSGGFLADSLIDGEVNSGSQQQWFARNSDWGKWTGARWNMVYAGVDHAPQADHWPEPANTVVEKMPMIREKPYLSVGAAGQLQVVRPALRKHSLGVSWQSSHADKTLPMHRFYIAKPERDTATSLNAALAQGKHLLLTPGIYRLQRPLMISKPNTIVLGLGLATLQATAGNALLQVKDVDGVSLAGILLDAGEQNSRLLMQIGSTQSHHRHHHNPTVLHDIFIRIGGAGAANAEVALEINSHDVIGDNLWLWRADHGSGVGWDVNHTRHGLIVNGEHVTMYGLFVEHFHQTQTVWNGNHGAVYFYQSEAPYEPPTQDSWMNGAQNGYPSYYIAPHVTHHIALGLGVYCWFDDNPQVKLHSAIEAPLQHPNVILRDMTTVSLGGKGEITHVLNDLGDKADDKNNVVRLKQP